MSAQWPSAVVTTSQLYVAVNELQNNLSAGINSAVTTIALNSATGFPTVGLVLIDNEVIQYTNVSGNSLTGCTRAFDGTSAATHSSGATVSFAFCAAHYNNAANEVIAVESYLDTVLGKGTTVTAAEFARLSGVTSAIQTQLNAKAPTASPTFTGTIVLPTAPSVALISNASSQLAISLTTDTELSYVHGVTSAIQTQLGLKAPLASPTFTGTVTVPNGSGSTDAAAFGQLPTVTNGTYTPTITGAGTVAANTGFYHRIGNMVHVWGSFQAGTVSGSNVSISLPVGSAVYTNRYPTNGSAFVGWFNPMYLGRNIASASLAILFLDGSDTTAVYFTQLAPTSGTAAWPKETGSSGLVSSSYNAYDFWYATA